MKQDTKPAPFNVGDHVRYIAKQKRTLAAGDGNATELVLVPGMEGVVILSTGALGEGTAGSQPWHCKVQFENGFQLDVGPENCADFAAPGA